MNPIAKVWTLLFGAKRELNDTGIGCMGDDSERLQARLELIGRMQSREEDTCDDSAVDRGS